MARDQRGCFIIKGIKMDKKIDDLLNSYARVNFESDLVSLEKDVNLRLQHRVAESRGLAGWLKACFGVPSYVGIPAMALTLFLGLYMGAVTQKASPLFPQDQLGLEVLAADNNLLPSTLLNVSQ